MANVGEKMTDNNHKNRKRQVDVEKLTSKQADELSEQLGVEIAKILDDASDKCNKLLNIYGMTVLLEHKYVKNEDAEKIKKEIREDRIKKVK